MKARRYNKGKNRISLIPTEVLEELSKVYTLGAHKYTIYKDKEGNEILGSEILFKDVSKYEIVEDGANNWKLGLPISNYLDSAFRHIEEFRKGNDIDELGTDTLYNAIWNLVAAHWTKKYHPQLDDRDIWWKKPIKRVYLDLDGVVFNFEKAFLEFIGEDVISPSDWNDYRFKDNFNLVEYNEEFWENIPPLIKPEDITYPIEGYCTSRPCSIDAIRNSLKKNGFPSGKIINTDNKLKSEFIDKDIIMVDDAMKNFIDLHSNGITCYLMTRPHNIKYDVGSYRVNNLKEFFDKIKI